MVYVKMEIPEVKNIVKELFASPLGTIPRGSIETSLQVSLSSTPTKIILQNKRGILVSLTKKSNLWVVNDTDEYGTLQEALFFMLQPILLDEISFKVR